MTIKCLDHIAICVEDIEKSLKWYAEHLDIKIKYQDKRLEIKKDCQKNLEQLKSYIIR